MGDRRGRFALGGFALWVLLLLSVGGAQAATLFVTNTSDSGVSGDGSLRGEILAASSGDVINFNVSGTITLGSTLPTIGINLTIDGSGQSVTVDGANSFQIFRVVGTLNLKFLTLAHGSLTGTNGFGGDARGGAIFNLGTLNVTNSTFSDNQAVGGSSADNGGNGQGGAIANLGDTLVVSNCTFSGNKAVGGFGAPGGDGDGGAIFSNGFGTLNVTNSTFSGNQAVGGAGGGRGHGGAILNVDTLNVTNSTFSGNQAVGGNGDGPGDGGAIFNSGFGTLTFTTFSDNQATGSGEFASVGGAIDNNSGTVSLHGTILAGSTGGNCAGTTTDAGYNISDDNSCGFTMPPGGTSINSSTTLHLDALANNGGPTNTIALELDSEAVDFIPVASCTDQSATPQRLTTDQRGLPRPDFGNPRFCDAGAFELQTTPIVIEANGERLQIVHASNPSGNQLNTSFTFIENRSPTCDAADDPFNGIIVTVSTGTCANLGNNAFSLFLDPFTVHTVNHQTYGTLFSANPPATLSVRMVELPTPAPPACGEWTMNLEFAGIDLTSLGNGPFALILSESDGEQGCLDITNAIVGTQIPPPGHGVRRRVRRR